MYLQLPGRHNFCESPKFRSHGILKWCNRARALHLTHVRSYLRTYLTVVAASKNFYIAQFHCRSQRGKTKCHSEAGIHCHLIYFYFLLSVAM